MSQILVSVIIPVYKTNLDLLERCIQSVLCQKYSNFECIVVDDGNSFEYADKLNEMVNLDRRIKVLHKENGGLGNTRNYGTVNAEGEYILYLDSDDYISPYTLLNGVEIVEKYHPDIVVGGLQHVKPDEELVFVEKPYKEITINSTVDFNQYVNHISGVKSEKYSITSGRIGPSACGKLVKKDLVIRAPFENDKFWDEDNLWNIAITAECKKIVILDTIWYAYIINPDSMVRGYAGSRIYEFQYRAKQVYERIETKWPQCMQAAFFSVWNGFLTFCRTDIFQTNNIKTKQERYSDFCKGIDFRVFGESMRQIDFNIEKRFIHRMIKKFIRWTYTHNYIHVFFSLLWVCTRIIKF